MPLPLQAVTFGDVNGDGELEVVFGTSSGYLYALSGKTGLDLPNFPFRTHGRIAASVLITQLTAGLSQQLVVMSFDGHLYMVDGITGTPCPAALCCAVLGWAVLCCAQLCCTGLCCAWLGWVFWNAASCLFQRGYLHCIWLVVLGAMMQAHLVATWPTVSCNNLACKRLLL